LQLADVPADLVRHDLIMNHSLANARAERF
jgi:hypothetical protein